ncbi:hypothetical protein [Janthinobacterium sp.]|uniref:hypothetical protein n=1 Tax=Janthinobacterium sp. TaxID=1871054 RepID=UPI00260430A3|nr:hypothetical protein [Janthinobacterium sp.]
MDKDTAASRETASKGGTGGERYNKKQAEKSRISGFVLFVATITKVRRHAPGLAAQMHQRMALGGGMV